MPRATKKPPAIRLMAMAVSRYCAGRTPLLSIKMPTPKPTKIPPKTVIINLMNPIIVFFY